MADLPDTHQPLCPSKCEKSWGLGPKYIRVSPDEERIHHQRNQWLGRFLKNGLVLVGVALLGFWLIWLTIRTGEMLVKVFYILSSIYLIWGESL